MEMNLVVLAGQLAAPAELRTFETGSSILRLLVTIRASAPRRRVDVIPVTLWDPPDEISAPLPVRGDRVFVTGSVQRRFWESPDGRRSRLEIVAHQVQRHVESADHPVPLGFDHGDADSGPDRGGNPDPAVSHRVETGSSR